MIEYLINKFQLSAQPHRNICALRAAQIVLTYVEVRLF